MSTSSESPQPDERAIEIFCDVVFGYLEGFAPVRLLAEKGTPSQKPRSTYQRSSSVPAALKRMAGPAAANAQGLFVVPGTVMKPGSAKAADIAETGVIVIDLDTGDIAAKHAHLVHHLGMPSMEVISGGRTEAGQDKLHLYWRLTEAARGADLQRVKDVRSDVARKVGGDPALGSLHQPIRVPGSVHGKNGLRAPVRLRNCSPVEYELDDLYERVAAMPSLPGLLEDPATHRDGPSAAQLQTMRVREGGLDGISRFDAITKICGHWIRNARLGRCTMAEAWVAVRDYNAAMISPPWDEARLRRDFENLAQIDAASVNVRHRGGLAADYAGHSSMPLSQSEDALAAEFVRAQGENWRHVASWGAWFAWNGTQWRPDDTGAVREAVRLVCRAAAAEAEGASQARRLASDKTITAVLRIASSDPRVAARPEDWDSHPMLINTPSGHVDLRSGEVRDHERTRLISQMTSAAPKRGCPRWETFLDEVLGGNGELKAYLKRFCGYCLTGSTREQVFVFLHGQGANGKSVFLQTISALLGTYASTATLDTFMASRTDRHLTELAGLRGARLVLVPETEAGRAWAEGRIKSVTGGERVRANFMRQNHFEFTPQFKLIVAGNHRPELRRTGEAMRRRLHLVPFTVTIPPERRDKRLAEKLLDEAEGILGWMIEGCLEWQRGGLNPPASVTSAVDDYLEDEDVVGQWIAEQCVTGSAHRATASDLYLSWSRWAECAGYDRGSQKVLGAQLRERGFSPAKVGSTRGWLGIKLRHSAAEASA
ncbi:phage/plasmid primase, P4 family [Defluviimonas salinarum]|uniref:Phage/plasmid primase, P4 family n=1 Tax=Defluviimonas salinarum TaxID=2992147 RepID=A0ABT3JAV9_9RHOB|nr:phage/plasmid primase, P4 family [Defluviimonas salinarum]MCW3784570.1 phage/plasmid primase, P4 family [Defluviimonas salinarum]